MAKTKSALLAFFKSLKPRLVKLNSTPKGRILGAGSLIAISALIVGLSTLNPAGSNSPNGNRPGSGMLDHESSQDYASANPTDEPQAQPSQRPISGPNASQWASEQAESEADKAIRLEKARLAALDVRDSFLVALKLTALNYIEAAKEAESKGDETNKANAGKLKAAANAVLSAIEPLAAKTKLEWPKLDVEPSEQDLQDKRIDFSLFSSDLKGLQEATDSDFNLAFNFYVTSSIQNLVDFVGSRAMPDDKDLKTLVALIKSDFESLGKKSGN